MQYHIYSQCTSILPFSPPISSNLDISDNYSSASVCRSHLLYSFHRETTSSISDSELSHTYYRFFLPPLCWLYLYSFSGSMLSDEGFSAWKWNPHAFSTSTSLHEVVSDTPENLFSELCCIQDKDIILPQIYQPSLWCAWCSSSHKNDESS